jgi:hypothetical protein
MNPSQPNSAAAGPRAPWRVNGLVVLVVLVVVGMGVTSVFFQWRAPQLYDEMQRVRADTPQSGEPRVDKWLVYGRPFFHARLIQLRYSSSQPWLVTHTVGGERAREPVEIWGVDFAALAPEATSRDGMVVTLTLPEPRLLARERFGLDGNDMANQVPHYPDAASAPDPRQRARSIVEWALKRLLDELGKDIEGATFEVRFAPSGAPVGG